MLRTLLIGIFLLSASCKQMDDFSRAASADASAIYIALGPDSSGKAVVLASSQLELSDPSICLNSRSVCDSGGSPKLSLKNVTLSNGRKVFHSAEAVSLAIDTMITARGRDKSGSDVSVTVQVVSKGGGGTTPSSTSLTLGSGGALGAGERQFAASNGKSSKFRLDVPQTNSATKAHGLLVYLHGDGGGDYNSVFAGLKSVADKHDLVPVSVTSPTTNENGVTWWVDADKNAVFLDELIKKEILAQYNIDKHRVVFTGISGGPTFMTGPWIRHYASQYRGGAINFCGGLVNTQMPFKDQDGFKANFPLYFYVGDGDFLLPGAKSAVDYYQKQGMKVEAEYPSGVGHCTFMGQISKLIDERVQKIFNTKSISLTDYGPEIVAVPDEQFSLMRPEDLVMDEAGVIVNSAP